VGYKVMADCAVFVYIDNSVFKVEDFLRGATR
jgi:hypothetical protein